MECFVSILWTIQNVICRNFLLVCPAATELNSLKGFTLKAKNINAVFKAMAGKIAKHQANFSWKDFAGVVAQSLSHV